MAEKTKTKEGRSGGNKGSYGGEEGKGEQALRQHLCITARWWGAGKSNSAIPKRDPIQSRQPGQYRPSFGVCLISIRHGGPTSPQYTRNWTLTVAAVLPWHFPPPYNKSLRHPSLAPVESGSKIVVEMF